MIVAPLAVFMVIFEELIREKTENLRRGMQLLGTLDSAYWASWILTAVFINTIVSTEIILLGKLAGFHCFIRAPFIINFMLYFLTTQTYIFIAFFLTSIVNSRSQAFTISFSIVLISMVMQILIAQP